jgi:hypothetical protein
MDQHTHGRLSPQARRVRRTLLQAPDLCFGKLLPAAQITAALTRHGVEFRERLYTPLLTLWMFLYQVLSPDPSCRAAVARLLAFLGAQGDASASADTGPYCKARERVPEAVVADLAQQSGQRLQARFPSTQLLHGRPILIADGTTVSMPDTPENQEAYPQPASQKAGLGFPLLRVVGLLSLSCGAVLAVALGPYSGKKTGETALLRQLYGTLQAGAVLLADALFANYWSIIELWGRNVDVVFRHDGKRRVDWGQGRRLGKKDHLVLWSKPARPRWMSPRAYRRIPDTLGLREVCIPVTQPGFRTRQVVLVTTLADAQLYPKEELAAAYRCRWHVELDLRAIKQVMGMDILRCKTPAMVRKELWMHLLAYNLVRTLMAEAATAAGVRPRELSFKGTLQTLNAFAAVWTLARRPGPTLYPALLKAVATHRVGDRPNRIEPRAVKRKPKTQTFLTEPRQLARTRLLVNT